MTWGDRFEDGLVHLGDYPDDGETLTQEEFLDGTMRGQDAHSSAVPVSMSAEGSRAETRGGEHSAQCGGTPGAFGLLLGAVGRLLRAVLLALVGKGAWTRAGARERALRARER